MFFNLDLPTSGGLSTLHSTPSDFRFFPLQPNISRFIARHSRRSVQPTRQIWSPCMLIITVTCLMDRCFVITLCFLFFLSCNLFFWVLVSLGDPFTGFFVLLFVVPVLFHIQISARPSLSKGLFWTGLKASAWVMPLFNIDLVSNPLCEDQALTLFKVDRVRTFLVLLELKTHHSLIDYYFTSYFGIIFLDLGLLMGNPLLCFFVICNFFIESNSYLPKKKKKNKSGRSR
jgi:hypothetical protein